MTQAMFQVLIVEDDERIRDLVKMLLESQHYRVVEAEPPRAARQRHVTIGRTLSSSTSVCRTATDFP